jgi:hypothetical protein
VYSYEEAYGGAPAAGAGGSGAGASIGSGGSSASASSISAKPLQVRFPAPPRAAPQAPGGRGGASAPAGEARSGRRRDRAAIQESATRGRRLQQAREQGVPVSTLFARLPQRATGAGVIDAFPQAASEAIVRRFRPAEPGIQQVGFDADTLRIEREDGTASLIAAGDPLAIDLLGEVDQHTGNTPVDVK